MLGVDEYGAVIGTVDEDEGGPETAEEMAAAWLADGDPVDVIVAALGIVYGLSEREATSLIEYVG